MQRLDVVVRSCDMTIERRPSLRRYLTKVRECPEAALPAVGAFVLPGLLPAVRRENRQRAKCQLHVNEGPSAPFTGGLRGGAAQLLSPG